jgi:hypothetical protein
MQCCGDPFTVRDMVRWTAVPADAALAIELGAAAPFGIDWIEEHHQEPTEQVSKIEGIVTDILAVEQMFVRKLPDQNKFVAVKGQARTNQLTEANGWESELTGRELPGYSFTGYLVTLS